MASSLSSLPSNRVAAGLISSGLAVMLLAQLVEGIPIASAMAVVGWGAVLLASARPNGARLALVNLAIYIALVGFALASKAHAILQSADGTTSLLTLADFALAIEILIGLTAHTLSSALTSISEEQ